MSSWYTDAKQCDTPHIVTSLRKHNMRVDMHVHVGEANDYNTSNDLDSALKALITSAMYKGLDVIGIITHAGPDVGWRGFNIVKNSNYDLYVVPGQEYVSTDKFRILAYKLTIPLPVNLTAEQAITFVHQKGGLVIAINITKNQAKQYVKWIGTPAAPDGVEIYNAVIGGYQDVDVDEFPKFISSSAKSSAELERTNVFTIINRDILTKIGIIPENEGSEYIPNYLLTPADKQQRLQAQQPQQPVQGQP